MSHSPPRQDLENAAWVTIPTRLSPNRLLDFCSSVDRLYRLNPYLKIHSWKCDKDCFCEAEWENSSMEPPQKLSFKFTVQRLENEWQINYQSGIKRKSLLIVEPDGSGSTLTIVDDYGSSGDREAAHVDRSLHGWGQALRRFFAGYAWLQQIPLMPSVIDRFWIRQTPTGRRITYILLVITAIELVLLLLFVLLYSVL